MNTIKDAPRILVFGGLNMGLITQSSRLPEPRETLRGDRFYHSSGGKGATQAVAAARQGAQVKMIGRVGNDLFGPALLAALRQDQIDISDIMIDPDHATGVGVIILDDSGQNRVLATYGANLQCNENQLVAVEQSLDQTDILMLQMEIPFELSLQAAQRAKQRGLRTILDPAPAPMVTLHEDYFKDLYLITPNETEAKRLTGIEVSDIQAAEKAAMKLLATGVKNVAITMGADGVLLAQQGAMKKITSPEVDAVDTTAAGDCFNGALAVGIASGLTLEESVERACIAASISVTRKGAQDAMPYAEEINECLS